MRTCDVAIIGLGIMGSAVLYTLAKQGVDVIGFDPIAIGEARGSSHGSCRVFRRFNFESPAYTALSDHALTAWRELEAASGQRVLIPSPVLEAGPPGNVTVAGSRAAALAAGVAADGPTTGAEANALFPAFSLPDGWDVVVQGGGGIVLAEAALRAFRAAALGRIVPEGARFATGPNAITITTASGERYEAKMLIVAAGPWIGDLLPTLRPHLVTTRQTVGWFEPSLPALARPDAFPVFMLDTPGGFVYGFPDFEGRGVKAARHDLGPSAGADEWGPPASNAELAAVSDTLRAYIPGAFGRIVDRDVCLYTNTLAGDADGSPAEEFIVDRWPDDPRIIVASPCSGHGFKFASAIGQIVARMATDTAAGADPAFRLARFSSFAD
jgi:sarcosine oxidase